MHFNQAVVGMLRIFTENSSVGTQATMPWLEKTAGGNESAMSRSDCVSKKRWSLNLIQPLVSERSDNLPAIHPVQTGSNRISKQNILIELVHFCSFLNANSMTTVCIIINV